MDFRLDYAPTIIGASALRDIAKQIFQVHGINKAGAIVPDYDYLILSDRKLSAANNEKVYRRQLPCLGKFEARCLFYRHL